MLKGLAITPPVVGRISIGKVVEHDGKRIPQKDDQFTITSQVQTKNGWLLHPLNEELRSDNSDSKLRRIPIRLMFDDPELNFRADYSLFDRSNGRPMCVGNGETCKRMTAEGIQTLPCPGADQCHIGQSQGCKPYGRLNVLIGDDDNLETFVFRTTGFNSIRTLIARLHYLKAISGGLLSCLPLELRLRGKSTRMSYGQAVYYADITLREGMTLERTLEEARQTRERRKSAGINQQALDEAAHHCLSNGIFEDGEDDGQLVTEEFYPVEEEFDLHDLSNQSKPEVIYPAMLTDKLKQKALQSAQSSH